MILIVKNTKILTQKYGKYENKRKKKILICQPKYILESKADLRWIK